MSWKLIALVAPGCCEHTFSEGWSAWLPLIPTPLVDWRHVISAAPLLGFRSCVRAQMVRSRWSGSPTVGKCVCKFEQPGGLGLLLGFQEANEKAPTVETVGAGTSL